MKYIFGKVLSPYKTKILICSIALAFLIMLVFWGKSRIDLETVAVSQNEKLIACFQTGNGPKILCYSTNGTLAFSYDVTSEISAGGHCALWFEEEILYALFYRTKKMISFSADGTIIGTQDSKLEEYPEVFPHFVKKGHKFAYYGNNVDVVYNKGSFIGYWFLGAERHLRILPKDGEAVTVMAWDSSK